MSEHSHKRAVHPLETLTVIALLVAGGFCYLHLVEGSRENGRAADNLQKATALADQISILRQKPSRVAALSRSERSLAKTVEQAAASVQVGPASIARIDPQAPQRAGDSDYLEHATVVQLEGVTLRQSAALLARLCSLRGGPDRLHCTSIRASTHYQAKPDGAAEELWNVELRLTYFVYSPNKRSSS